MTTHPQATAHGIRRTGLAHFSGKHLSEAPNDAKFGDVPADDITNPNSRTYLRALADQIAANRRDPVWGDRS